MFKTAFEKKLDKATSHLLMEPNWDETIAICDIVRQGDVGPKFALGLLKKKLLSDNPHSAYHALLVLESMVKNCGVPLHEELTSEPFCEALHELAKTTKHDNIKTKLLELLQSWSSAFRGNSRHQPLLDLYDTMKMEGFKFPALKESEAMFSITTAPKWADGEHCHRCRVQFTMIQRKHHCRACGQVFCGSCSQKATTLPKLGIEKEVRVCDACYEQANKATAAKAAKETGLPIEYLKSSLSQQKQGPPKKSEDELREEEELELALALSKSEAEAKEQSKKYNTYNSYKVPESRPVEPVATTAPKEEEEVLNPELLKYLNRPYWESKTTNEKSRPTSPSAPDTITTTIPLQNNGSKTTRAKENGYAANELEDFISTLKSHVEIFINRMKSNSSRGRSIANDTSVQTLFMNITAMHSRLLHYIKEHDDSRMHFERLQDKLNQVKDARAALDALRDEHREKLRREAEEAERQRQLQMAHKLEIMRKKKQEYLHYQHQLALQRVQEQEREMQMRQEQQKQQYLIGGVSQQHMMNLNYGYTQPPGSSQSIGYPPYHPSQMGQQPPHHPGLMGQQPPHHPGLMGQQPPRPMQTAPPQMPYHQPMMMPDPQMMYQNAPPGVPMTKSDPGPSQARQMMPPPQQQQFQQPGAPPASPQVVEPKADPETAELISFD